MTKLQIKYITIKYLFICSIALNIFLVWSLPNLNYIKILHRIDDVETSARKYIDPTVPFSFRSSSGSVSDEKNCMHDGSAKLMQTTIDHDRQFVFSTFQCQKGDFTQEMNVALSFYHDDDFYNVYFDAKKSDLNISIGEIASVDRRDMGL